MNNLIKQIIISFFLIGLLGCGSEPPAEKVTDNNNIPKPEQDTFYLGNILVHLEKIQKTDFDKVSENPVDTANEALLLRRDSSLVSRSGDTLFFMTGRGKVTLLNIESEGDNYSNYLYKGYLKDMNQFLVYGAFYEWFNYQLIDRITGDTTALSGEPVLSPDKKRFISGNSDLMAGFTFNGIELYKSTHKPELIGARALGKWGPNIIKWLDNRTLVIECNVSDTTLENMERLDYFKLTLD
jgi:hypothetical protein